MVNLELVKRSFI